MKLRPPPSVAVRMALAGAALVLSSGIARSSQSAADLRTSALDFAYNLDHDQALDLIRRAILQAPDDPAPHRSLAGILWLNILFRRGAVTVDHYLGSFTAKVDVAKPPAEIDREFREEVGKAIALAEKRTSANPKDPQGHYDVGAALGLRASYVATVEGRLMAGFRAAQQSYDEHEKVLALAPWRKDAELIVGTYRYVVSTLSLPVRMMAYVAGFGGGRERGIQMLEDAAAAKVVSGGTVTMVNDARVDALFALILVYNRERRFDDALRVLEELRRFYPRNRLLLLEAGATALRGGKAQQADDLLTEGLAAYARDTRPKMPGEEALWHYKRGASRAALGRTDAANEDLRIALGQGAQAWVAGRARVELGRLALKRGDRTAAATYAREAATFCERGNDPVCVQDARNLLRNSNGR